MNKQTKIIYAIEVTPVWSEDGTYVHDFTFEDRDDAVLHMQRLADEEIDTYREMYDSSEEHGYFYDLDREGGSLTLKQRTNDVCYYDIVTRTLVLR